MARTELFDLFFHPVFQKCLRHAESTMSPDGNVSKVFWKQQPEFLLLVKFKRNLVTVKLDWYLN